MLRRLLLGLLQQFRCFIRATAGTRLVCSIDQRMYPLIVPRCCIHLVTWSLGRVNRPRNLASLPRHTSSEELVHNVASVAKVARSLVHTVKNREHPAFRVTVPH
jgi:hypothetical protein